jgi:hypothetical protein
MKHNQFGIPMTLAAALFLMSLPQVSAHCDALDGPVIKAAEKALESSNIKLVLPWVQKGDELEIENAFHRTLSVRKLSPDAKELADRFFFETVVRVHRAGEGAVFTGLKPPGTGVTPAIAGADRALITGDVTSLVEELKRQVSDGIRARFKNAAMKKNFVPSDVEGGRAYVHAYVEYIHYVEGIHGATVKPSEHHAKTDVASHAEAGKHATTEKTTHQH